MTRREALALLIIAFVVICVGGFLAFGPWGLMTCGSALATFALLVNDIPEEKRGESPAKPATAREIRRGVKV